MEFFDPTKYPKSNETFEQMVQRIKSEADPENMIYHFSIGDLKEQDVIDVILEKNDVNFKEQIKKEVDQAIEETKKTNPDFIPPKEIEEDQQYIDEMIEDLRSLRRALERIML
jgi:hypothetical protein